MKNLSSLFTLTEQFLRLEFRTQTALLTHALFLGVSLFIFAVALPQGLVPPEYANAGVLWSTLFLSSSSLAGALFMRSPQHAFTESLLLCGLPPQLIFLARSLTLFALMLVLVGMALPLLTLFSPVSHSTGLASLIAIILLACASYACVASLFSSLMAKERFSELLLPVLVLPITLPILIVCVKATTESFLGLAPQGLFFLLGYALVMIPASTLLSEYVIEME